MERVNQGILVGLERNVEAKRDANGRLGSRSSLKQNSVHDSRK